MTAQRLSVKLFFEENDIELVDFIPVFHQWIQEGVTDDLLIDVVDYTHVEDGPGLILVGGEGDYGLEKINGRLGLKYTRKREWPVENLAERIQLTNQHAQEAAGLLEQFTLTGDVEISMLDRLRYPNTDSGLAAIRGEIGDAYSATAVSRKSDDEREALTLVLNTSTISLN